MRLPRLKWSYQHLKNLTQVPYNIQILLLVKSSTLNVEKDSLPQVSRKLRIPPSPTAQCIRDNSRRWWQPLSRLWARNLSWYATSFVLCRLQWKGKARESQVVATVNARHLTKTFAARGTDWGPWPTGLCPGALVDCSQFGNECLPSLCCSSAAVGVSPVDWPTGNQAECDLWLSWLIKHLLEVHGNE